MPGNQIDESTKPAVNPVCIVWDTAKAFPSSTVHGELDEGQPERQEDLRQVQSDPA
jgi:hypothetical protein